MKTNILLAVLITCDIWLSVVLILNKQKCESKLSLLQAKSIDIVQSKLQALFLINAI